MFIMQYRKNIRVEIRQKKMGIASYINIPMSFVMRLTQNQNESIIPILQHVHTI